MREKSINSLDIEASDLYGYPIQVGIIKENGETFSEYIVPHEQWVDDFIWSYNAQCIHGITPEKIYKDGLSLVEIAEKLNDFLGFDVLYADSNFDLIWMSMIFEYAEIKPTFKTVFLFDVFDKNILENWSSVFFSKQKETGLRVHDALNDAILNQMTFEEIFKNK